MKSYHITDYIKANNLNHDIMNRESYTFMDGITRTEYMIGFEKKGKGLVYHWFNVTIKTDADGNVLSDYAMFDHSYSMRTGSVKRGTMHGIDVKEAIHKFIDNN